jgi:hypothetical protein
MMINQWARTNDDARRIAIVPRRILPQRGSRLDMSQIANDRAACSPADDD